LKLVSKSLEFWASKTRISAAEETLGADIVANSGLEVMTKFKLSLAVKPSTKTETLTV